MTKNILVTDENGTIIGATYPKRAKGLIKSGRATEVDELTIRLVSSVASGAFSVYLKDTEEKEMANVIEFKARAFQLAEDCETNCGSRLMVTENGDNVECFEIGQGGALTQIEYELDELEEDQDYVFRFTIKSRYVRAEAAESMVSIWFDEEGDGYTYPMDRDNRNRFKPVLCKKTEDGILRVFELPFNSGDSSSATIRIAVHDMTAWIYPAKNIEAYAAMEDVDYEQWRQDEIHQVAKKLNDLGGSLGEKINGFGEFMGEMGGKLTKAVSDAINRPAAANAGKKEEGAEVIINGPEEAAPATEEAASAEEAAPAEEAVAAAAEEPKTDSTDEA